LLGIAAKKSVPLSFPHAGMVLYREPRLSMTVLSPPARLFYHTKSDANNNSLVILLRHGATSILFTGDAEQAALVRLFHSYPALRCTLIKVPHHGSVTGLVPGMYSRLAPQAAVITGGPAGAPPAPAVLGALSAARVRVYRTDREGPLTVRGDGRRLTVSARYAPRWP
jgi:competence protein ComEC